MTAQPLAMALDHADGQRLTQTIEFLRSDGILRQRPLRSQIAVEQQLVRSDRWPGIVARIATRD
jgi:hypothetical protein